MLQPPAWTVNFTAFVFPREEACCKPLAWTVKRTAFVFPCAEGCCKPPAWTVNCAAFVTGAITFCKCCCTGYTTAADGVADGARVAPDAKAAILMLVL